MARPLRIEYEGSIYHITDRGNTKQKIYLDSEDKEKFLQIIQTTIKRTGWICHSYVLMDNHYHLLIETPKANLSKGMQHLNGCYAQYFNKRHNRIGHLFQERFKSLLVEKESYLLSLCRYILRNPVRAKIVKKPEGYIWSSYGAMIGNTTYPDFLHKEWILSQFSKNKNSAVKQFKDFISQDIELKFPEHEIAGQIVLGSTKFIDKINKLASKSIKSRDFEIPKEQNYIYRKELDEVFLVGIKSGKTRDEIIYLAYTQYDYYMKEIAKYLNIHYATVSRAVKKIENRLEMS